MHSDICFPALPAQSDNLLSYLTVEETLTFTAQLALKKHSTEAIRKKVKLHTLCFYSLSLFALIQVGQ